MAIEQHNIPDGRILYCSFCGKSQGEVNMLIAGPQVYICDKCVNLCAGIASGEHFEGLGSTNGERINIVIRSHNKPLKEDA